MAYKQQVIAHSSEGQAAESKAPVDLVSSEGSFCDSWMVPSHCVLILGKGHWLSGASVVRAVSSLLRVRPRDQIPSGRSHFLMPSCWDQVSVYDFW